MFNLLEEVRGFNIITIYRHQIADPDALGSQFGMKCFIQNAYPEKKVLALGDDVGSHANMFPEIDHASDEEVKESCAIILDTANIERIDDQRFASASKIIKIDHHIVVEEYADVEYVDTKAAATCEILTKLFHNDKQYIGKQCAKYLYLGLLADSNSFTTASTTAETLRCGAFLVEQGLDVNKINQERTGISMNDFKYVNKVRDRVQVEGSIAYSIMNTEDYEPLGMTYNSAKEKVFALAPVKDFEIYCLFTEDETYGERGLYNGSLRSKNVAINKVANKYNGGGHAHACGVKKLTLDDIHNLIEDFKKIV